MTNSQQALERARRSQFGAALYSSDPYFYCGGGPSALPARARGHRLCAEDAGPDPMGELIFALDNLYEWYGHRPRREMVI